MALAGSLGLLVIAEELLWRGLLLSALMCAGMGGGGGDVEHAGGSASITWPWLNCPGMTAGCWH